MIGRLIRRATWRDEGARDGVAWEIRDRRRSWSRMWHRHRRFELKCHGALLRRWAEGLKRREAAEEAAREREERLRRRKTPAARAMWAMTVPYEVRREFREAHTRGVHHQRGHRWRRWIGNPDEREW
jgi:hypothetical protein